MIREPNQLTATRRVFQLEPAGLPLAEPAILELNAPSDAILTAFLDTPCNDAVEAGSELTTWRNANVVEHDGETFRIELNRLGRVIASWDQGDVAMLAFDIPENNLRPGDIAVALTRVETDTYPSWRPGHVAMLSCIDEDGDGRVIESTRRTGVCRGLYEDLRTDYDHLLLGVRRPLGLFLDDTERRTLLEAVMARQSDEAGYAIAGHVDEEHESSASLVELAHEAVFEELMPGPRTVFGLTPYEIYRSSSPVDTIHVDQDEIFEMQISLLAMAGEGLTEADQHVGGYAPTGTIELSEPLEGATLMGTTTDGVYIFEWKPQRSQVGQAHEVTFIGTGHAFTDRTREFHVEQTITFDVLGVWNDFDVYPRSGSMHVGDTYTYYGEIPEGVELGEHSLIVEETGLPVSEHPWEDHVMTILHQGLRPGDPSMAGIVFHVENVARSTLDLEPQVWIYTLDHRSGFWRGDENCADEGRCFPETDVNSTGDASDADPSDGVCDTGNTTAAGVPECTLRAAIEHTNADEGRDEIKFEIPGDGPHTILLDDELPVISDVVTIDGRSQSSASEPAIILDGSGLDFGSGLVFDGPGSRLTGFRVTGFPMNGVETTTPGVVNLELVELTDNGAWGLSAEGTVRLRGTSEQNSIISGNGTGTSAIGGGILIAAPWARYSSRIEHTEISDNGGPGVLSSMGAAIADVQVLRNDGPGLLMGHAYANCLASNNVHVTEGRLTVAENNWHGIQLYSGHLNVEYTGSLEVTGNGGWGVFVELGRAMLADSGFGTSAPNFISNNGTGSGCRAWALDDGVPASYAEECGGGGVFQYYGINNRTGVVISNIEISDNAGPGVMASNPITTFNAEILRNAGSGISVPSISDGGVYHRLGDLVISENQGAGIDMASGDIRTEYAARIQVTDNNGWGIYLRFGRPELGDRGLGSERTHSVTGNGRGAVCFLWDLDDTGFPVAESVDCAGGGIFFDEPDPSAAYFHDVDISDNGGPGVLAAGKVTMSRAVIADNDGDGMVIAETDNPAGASTAVIRTELGENIIRNNGGDGIRIESGATLFNRSVEVVDNAGWGVHIWEGNFEIETYGFEIWSVSRNGAGSSCERWTVLATGRPFPSTEPCNGGGLWVQEGDLDGAQLTVRENTGDGIRITGDLTLADSAVCRNSEDQIDITDGTLDLTDVDEVCP